ncbi:hypothetical protein [Parasporobacterium paucivorans]|uniref:Uncharacterized protein n=1 Tax=Parasporobacterium paucivorans DSM 15970 TaxID=1122934 RepID=A0A1M6EJ35_9FIRM|nr:hypothetical protein [Parasporobacterium paucivorans]SHI85441.1 hypothetical protein SAMN02745691_00923 [Parasporobacterium paucivorans DSM 15970]
MDIKQFEKYLHEFRLAYEEWQRNMETELNETQEKMTDEDLISISLIDSMEKFRKLNKGNKNK